MNILGYFSKMLFGCLEDLTGVRPTVSRYDNKPTAI